MGLMATIKRGRPSKGLRQINIRYEVSDPTWKEIEDLMEHAPYKKVNEVMRYALLMGAKIVLSTNEPGSPIVLNLPSQPKKPVEPAFSPAASAMFDSYGGDKG